MKEEILLIGNPNTGKTSLFNTLTKSGEHVGNWHGVTVEVKKKQIVSGKKSPDKKEKILCDLPGIYSLSPTGFDEEEAIHFLMQNRDKKIVNIVDIRNLNHNLFLTFLLQKNGFDFVCFINDFGNQMPLNLSQFSDFFNIPFFRGNACKKKQTEQLKSYLLEQENSTHTVQTNTTVSPLSEAEIFSIYSQIDNFLEKIGYNSTKKTEKEEEKGNFQSNNNASKRASKISFSNNTFSKKLDKILLNKVLAIPIFLLILLGVFYFTFFSVGAFFSDLLRELIQTQIGAPFINFLSSFISTQWLIDLMQFGIIGGVGNLLSFLPQVALLFFFLSLLEDSGYLSRLAFLFDDILEKVGLSGKSVYTILMGFGCSTTAALTARNMEDNHARIKTTLLTPYMSCSAKLPIYAVVGGAFFGAANVWIIFSLYLLGILVAVSVSSVLEKGKLKSKKQGFLLEFPSYRLPSFPRMMHILWQNINLFLVRVGTLLISVNVIVWVLSSFSFDFSFVKLSGKASMLESFGRILSPLFTPLGFGTWGAVAALLAGLVAKEVIVSSLLMFNQLTLFTPASALAFMVFCLLYSPCLATLSVFHKEIGMRWTLVSVGMHLAIAYVLSLLVYHAYGLVAGLGLMATLLSLLGVLLIVVCFLNVAKKIKHKKLCGNCRLCPNPCAKQTKTEK